MIAPDLRLLRYAPTRPMLRVVRLPDAVADPAPVSLVTGYALDALGSGASVSTPAQP